MATDAQTILKQLHYVSATPPISAHAFPKLGNIIANVCKNPSKLQKYSSWSDIEIQDLILFLAKVIDAPSSLRGLLKITKALTILVAAFLDQIEADLAITKETMAVLDAFVEALNSAPDSDSYIYNRPPLMFESPLFYFHYRAHEFSIIDESAGACPLYVAYGITFHVAIRLHEAQQPNKHAHERKLMVSRDFFEHLSTRFKILPSHSHPDEVPTEYVNDAMINFSRSNYGTVDTLSNTATIYKANLKSLLNGYPLRRRRSPTGYTRRIDPGEDCMIYPNGLQGGLLISHEETKSGESDDDYPLSKTLVDMPGAELISNHKPYLYSGWADLVHLRNFVFFFDSDYLNLFHYSVLYSVLASCEGVSPHTNLISLFIYMLIHTGITPKLLINLTNEIQDPGSSLPVLRLINGRYFIMMPLIVKSKKYDSNVNCHESLRHILIPLPNKICELIVECLVPQEGSVFVFFHNGKHHKLNLDIIDDFLKKKINHSKQFSKYDLRITVTKIARSFPALYVSRYGFDPIMCAILKADRRERLYKSQAHYVYINRYDLETQYINTFKLADNAILANLERCIEQNSISSTSKSAIILTTDYTALINDYKDQGYGSSILPFDDYLPKTIEKLANAIRINNDTIFRFNLFSIYVYLCCQFSFGLRPNKISEISWSDYSFHKSLMVVRDKDSKDYFEERFLPAPPVLHELLVTLKRAVDTTCRHIALNIRPEISKEENDSMFRFFSDKGYAEQFSIKSVIKYLNRIDIAYDVRPNMPRHFLRDTLYQAGISNDLIDVYLGHTHAGRELLNIASSSHLEHISKHCMPVIIDMLDKLDFKAVNFWRKADSR